MWRSITLLLAIFHIVAGKLSGDHICEEEVRYTRNVTEYFMRNSTVRNYQWCMNVPPRCSFYTSKLVNDSRIVEREYTDILHKCCPGFEPNDDNTTCFQICQHCNNGMCHNGKCTCFPGFTGDNCDSECQSTRWGPDCQFECTCERGTCDSTSGSCICPPGWSGSDCQSICPPGLHGADCQEECQCGAHEKCDHITGACSRIAQENTQTSPNFKDDLIIPITKPPFYRDKSSETTVDHNQNPVLLFENNGKFKPNLTYGIEIFATSGTIVPSTREARPVVNDELTTNQNEPTTVSTQNRDYSVIHNDLTYGPIALTKSSEQDKITIASTSVVSPADNYLGVDQQNESTQAPSTNNANSDLVNRAGAAMAIALAVIMLALAIVVVYHFRQEDKNMKAGNRPSNYGVSTFSVYSRNIFHTPLPEVPESEHTTFNLPIMETSPICTEEREFHQTKIVCSMMNLKTTVPDSKEYVYDHPPSTGSYRAASLPDPDMENSHSTYPEPVYDEIPSGTVPTPITQPHPSSSFYVNTCAKTRL